MDSLSLIAALSNANGASGFEDEVVSVGKTYAEPFATIKEDSLRNLYLYRKKNTGNKPIVLIDGHSDEVSFMVQCIKPNGTLQFIPLGGWVDSTVPAHRVRVQTADGNYIIGVVASKPPHYMSEAERAQGISIANMVIDIGATSYDEVVNDFKIRVGAPVVPDVVFEYDAAHDMMLGKAFDCRLGCASVVETLERLDNESLDVDIVGTFSVQEEVGTRGSVVTANTVNPDIAIVFEGCPADDTFGERYAAQTMLKHGPMLRHIDRSMIANPRFMRYALNMAAKHQIPVQEAIRSGGGTNGGPIHLSNQSVPVIVMGIPVRYIHTHYCYATLADYHAGIQLACEIIKTLNKDQINQF